MSTSLKSCLNWMRFSDTLVCRAGGQLATSDWIMAELSFQSWSLLVSCYNTPKQSLVFTWVFLSCFSFYPSRVWQSSLINETLPLSRLRKTELMETSCNSLFPSHCRRLPSSTLASPPCPIYQSIHPFCLPHLLHPVPLSSYLNVL